MNTSIQELSLNEVQEVSGGFFSFGFGASFSFGFSCEPKQYSCEPKRPRSCDPKPLCEPKRSCDPKPSCGDDIVTLPPVDPGPILL